MVIRMPSDESSLHVNAPKVWSVSHVLFGFKEDLQLFARYSHGLKAGAWLALSEPKSLPKASLNDVGLNLNDLKRFLTVSGCGCLGMKQKTMQKLEKAKKIRNG